MNFDFPCTHPEGWPCNREADGSCATNEMYAKWVEQTVAAEQSGTGSSINISEKPDIVGGVDMTHDNDKLPLGVTGNSEVIPLPDDFNDVPDVNEHALAEWRKRKQR